MYERQPDPTLTEARRDMESRADATRQVELGLQDCGDRYQMPSSRGRFGGYDRQIEAELLQNFHLMSR